MTQAPGEARATCVGRMHHLDALRGLAAFVVVLHHALLSLPASDPLPAALHVLSLFRIVELGRPAVVLFFVLSGFVLAMSLEPARDMFAGFASRRAIRLLPPYWAAIAISFLLYRTIPHHQVHSLSPWLVSQWNVPLSNADFARHLAMRAGPRQYPLDHVAWSLVHELRLSLVVPPLVIVAARLGSVVCLGLAASVSVGASLIVAWRPELFPSFFHGFHFDAETVGPSLVLGARFVLLFAIGIVLARHRAAIMARLVGRRIAVGSGLAASLALLSQSDELAMACGAAGLIACVACSTACARSLSLAPLVWLGRSSYSLYLVHLPVMLACAFLLDGVLAPRAILALSIALALASAELLFQLVERPSIRWSRSVGRAFAMRASVAASIQTTPSTYNV